MLRHFLNIAHQPSNAILLERRRLHFKSLIQSPMKSVESFPLALYQILNEYFKLTCLALCRGYQLLLKRRSSFSHGRNSAFWRGPAQILSTHARLKCCLDGLHPGPLHRGKFQHPDICLKLWSICWSKINHFQKRGFREKNWMTKGNTNCSSPTSTDVGAKIMSHRVVVWKAF